MRDIVEMLDTHIQEDRRWQERANCLGVDPDLFFPERGRLHQGGEVGLPRMRGASRVPRVRPASR